jgi:hypothetical protein
MNYGGIHLASELQEHTHPEQNMWPDADREVCTIVIMLCPCSNGIVGDRPAGVTAALPNTLGAFYAISIRRAHHSNRSLTIVPCTHLCVWDSAMDSVPFHCSAVLK